MLDLEVWAVNSTVTVTNPAIAAQYIYTKVYVDESFTDVKVVWSKGQKNYEPFSSTDYKSDYIRASYGETSYLEYIGLVS